MAELKKVIQEYWQNNPCGTQFAKNKEDARRYFSEIEEHRYGYNLLFTVSVSLRGGAVKGFLKSEPEQMFKRFNNVRVIPILTSYYITAARPQFLRRSFFPVLRNLPARIGFFMVIQGEK